MRAAASRAISAVCFIGAMRCLAIVRAAAGLSISVAVLLSVSAGLLRGWAACCAGRIKAAVGCAGSARVAASGAVICARVRIFSGSGTGDVAAMIRSGRHLGFYKINGLRSSSSRRRSSSSSRRRTLRSQVRKNAMLSAKLLGTCLTARGVMRARAITSTMTRAYPASSTPPGLDHYHGR